MNIIYHCFGGAHSSVTAAAIHLGWLSSSQIPSFEELMNIPYFDVQIGADHGTFRFMGKDEQENNVYIIGRRNLRNDFEIIVHSLANIYDKEEECLLINTMPLVNWKMVIGGYLSRGLETPKFGRSIVVKGVQDSFLKYVALVNTIKNIYPNYNLSEKKFGSVLG